MRNNNQYKIYSSFFLGLMIIQSCKSELSLFEIFLHSMNYFISFIAEKQVA